MSATEYHSVMLCVHGFLGKVSVYMFLAPIRLATLKHFRNVLALGYLVQA